MRPFQLAVLVLPVLLACQSSEGATATRSSAAAAVHRSLDASLREELLSTVKALEGRWVMESPEGPSYVEFSVSSGGSVVREIMFPGHEHEMTNMYSLDGNSLVMTHYCAAGNQPRMRATALADNEIAFHTDGVGDLKATDDHYMGEMTLVVVDEDHIEQRWRSFAKGEPAESVVFALTRER